MTKSELMRHRRSVRTFDGREFKTEDAKKILEFARLTENPYEIPISWKILDARTNGLHSPVISGTDMYIAGKMIRRANAEEAFGYTFEKIVLYAESLGLGTTWIAGTMNRPEFERAMHLAADEVMPCVSPLGYPAKKMALRETLMRKGVKADSRIEFSRLFFNGSFDTPLTPEKAGDLKLAFEMVRLAPSAVNKQPWRAVLCDGYVHFYEKQSGGYVSADGWDLQKIDMGIALCHFELAAEECGVCTTFEVNDPGLPVNDGQIYIASFAVRPA